MPDVKPGENRDYFVSRCIPIVLEDGTAESNEQAVAICSQMWRDRAKALVMKVTKVQRLENGRTRWQARANTGEFDLLQERFDEDFFDDVIRNFYRTQEALSRGENPPDGMTEPILDISHYSIYLSREKRNLARVGWIAKMWRDGRALFAQGFFDDTRLGQIAEKAAFERKPEERRVSVVVYPDYSLVDVESGGRKVYRGGNGRAWMDSLAMTSTPCDPGAVMEVKSMSTLAEDAKTVLGDDGVDIVAELEAARTQKTLPDGAVIKAEWTTAFINDLPDSSFLFISPGGEKVDGKTEPRSLRHFPIKDASGKVDLPHLRNAIARIPQSNAEGLSEEMKSQLQDRARQMLESAQEEKTMSEEQEIKTEEIVEEIVTEATPDVAPLTMETLQGALDTLLPGIAQAIDQRFEPLSNQLAELAGKTVEFEAQLKALGAAETEKVQKAIQNDGDIFSRMWPDEKQLSVQGVSDTAKGTVKKVDETPYKPGDVQAALGLK